MLLLALISDLVSHLAPPVNQMHEATRLPGGSVSGEL